MSNGELLTQEEAEAVARELEVALKKILRGRHIGFHMVAVMQSNQGTINMALSNIKENEFAVKVLTESLADAVMRARGKNGE